MHEYNLVASIRNQPLPAIFYRTYLAIPPLTKLNGYRINYIVLFT